VTATTATITTRIVGGLAVGNLLNPLNSSMIAVALVNLSADFGVPLATVTWVVSAFYIGGGIGMPLMGQLADRFGARRVLAAGLVLVGITSGLAPVAPSLAVLVGLRVFQAVGTSAPYPAALAIFRRLDARGRAPAGALGAISITNSVSSALGPVLGGALVALAGWQAIFVANVPLVIVALVLALVWLPPDAARAGPRRRDADPAEQNNRGGTAEQPARVSAWRLLRSKPLLSVYAQFAAVNLVFYAVFYGLPLWLEQTRHYAPDATGLLLLPVAGIGIGATPIAARLITQRGPRPALLVGSGVLLAGSVLLFAFDDQTPVLVLLAVGAVLGVPNGFNNLGLQAALYEAATANQIGAAAGALQTCRYIGAVAATAIIGAVFGAEATSGSLHVLALVMAATSAALVLASVLAYRSSFSRQT
jgi:MFS family permease